MSRVPCFCIYRIRTLKCSLFRFSSTGCNQKNSNLAEHQNKFFLEEIPHPFCYRERCSWCPLVHIVPCAWQTWKRTRLLRWGTRFKPRADRFHFFAMFDRLESSGQFSVLTFFLTLNIPEPTGCIKRVVMRCFGTVALLLHGVGNLK